MLSADIFGDTPPNKVRFKKPVQPKFKKKDKAKPVNFEISAPKKLKKASEIKAPAEANLFGGELTVGNRVKHLKFGRGEVLSIEGKGGDVKAEIDFEFGGKKKLLLRFAKLELIG